MRGSPKIQERISFVTTLMALIIISCKMTPAARAAEKETTYIPVLRFSGGIAAAFTIHEGAHALVAELTGTDMHWEIGTHNQPLGFTEHASSDGKGAAITSAGLLSQAIGGELILRHDRIDKNDYFVRGLMAWNILNPISYALDYWFFRRTNQRKGDTYQGDIEGVEYYTNKPIAQGFALSLAGIGALQGYRFLKTQSWAPDWLKGKSHTVNFGPLPSGDLVMTCKFVF
jgi:hypothetical protein